MKKEDLIPKQVKHTRKTGLRLLNIGGRLRKDRQDQQDTDCGSGKQQKQER